MKQSGGHLLELEHGEQRAGDRAFIGGRPHLPPAVPLPVCLLCGEGLTFFFQVAFPPGHPWEGRQLALFACTSCYDEDSVIPAMLDGPLAGADVPSELIDRYQTNFRLIVSEAAHAVPRDDYEPRVAFRRLLLVAAEDAEEPRGKVGGEPVWILDDESPRSFDGTVPAVFLMQLDEGLHYAVLPGAPPQMTMTLFDGIQPSDEPSYTLFVDNGLYFFGSAAGRPLVYVLPQGA